MAPLAGVLDGMNGYGLTVTYNLAYTLDEPKCYAPLSMALQEMLETCKNTDEAAKFIVETKRGGHDAVLTLADARGDIKTVEITSNHSRRATRQVVRLSTLTITNQMRCKGMKYLVTLSILVKACGKKTLESEFMNLVSKG
jgi:predicted choloylglycine hydrolase